MFIWLWLLFNGVSSLVSFCWCGLGRCGVCLVKVIKVVCLVGCSGCGGGSMLLMVRVLLFVGVLMWIIIVCVIMLFSCWLCVLNRYDSRFSV